MPAGKRRRARAASGSTTDCVRASERKALVAEKAAWLEVHGVLERIWKLGPA